jgi:hypothetical protein
LLFYRLIAIFDAYFHIMEAYIKYKRFETELIVGSKDHQDFFDMLIKEGWQIIFYSEQSVNMFSHRVVVVAGKKQDNELKQVL